MSRTGSCLALAIALLLAACGGGPGPSAAASPSPAGVNTCATAKASRHLAYLVVQHLSGSARERCVGFDTDTIDGETLMRGSGIQYEAAVQGGTRVVCQIDGEPQQFSDCAAQDQPHWSLWLDTGAAWTVPTADYGGLRLGDRQALGWRYSVPAATSPSPPPLPVPL